MVLGFGTNAVLIVGPVFLFSSVTDIVGQGVLVVSSVADIARKVVKVQY